MFEKVHHMSIYVGLDIQIPNFKAYLKLSFKTTFKFMQNLHKHCKRLQILPLTLRITDKDQVEICALTSTNLNPFLFTHMNEIFYKPRQIH